MNSIVICSNTLARLPQRFLSEKVETVFHRDRKLNGVASAKNEAITKALLREELTQFAFVDCDDFIEFPALERAFQQLESSHNDFIYCPHFYVTHAGGKGHVKLKENLEQDIYYLHPFSYVFKRSILEKVYDKYGMFFTEQKKHSIGVPFLQRLMSVGARYSFCDIAFYTYFHRKNSNSLSNIYKKEKDDRRKHQVSSIVTI